LLLHVLTINSPRFEIFPLMPVAKPRARSARLTRKRRFPARVARPGVRT
jgi:hypothetical protein